MGESDFISILNKVRDVQADRELCEHMSTIQLFLGLTYLGFLKNYIMTLKLGTDFLSAKNKGFSHYWGMVFFEEGSQIFCILM